MCGTIITLVFVFIYHCVFCGTNVVDNMLESTIPTEFARLAQLTEIVLGKLMYGN